MPARPSRPRRAAAEEGGSPPEAAVLVRGDDASLVGQEVHDLLGTLVGTHDMAMVVEEHGGPGAEDLDVGLVVDALTTPPMLTDRRIVVRPRGGTTVVG